MTIVGHADVILMDIFVKKAYYFQGSYMTLRSIYSRLGDFFLDFFHTFYFECLLSGKKIPTTFIP